LKVNAWAFPLPVFLDVSPIDLKFVCDWLLWIGLANALLPLVLASTCATIQISSNLFRSSALPPLACAPDLAVTYQQKAMICRVRVTGAGCLPRAESQQRSEMEQMVTPL
jgi:hypothetical protein